MRVAQCRAGGLGDRGVVHPSEQDPRGRFDHVEHAARKGRRRDVGRQAHPAGPPPGAGRHRRGPQVGYDSRVPARTQAPQRAVEERGRPAGVGGGARGVNGPITEEATQLGLKLPAAVAHQPEHSLVDAGNRHATDGEHEDEPDRDVHDG